MKTIRPFNRVRGSLWGGTLAVIVMFTLLASSTSAQTSSPPTPEIAASPTPSPLTPPDQLQSPAGPAFPQDTPEIMVNELATEWAVGGGFIYWTYDCLSEVEFHQDGYLRRKPAHGSPTTISSTLQSIPWTDCVHYDSLAGDTDGLYYYKYDAYHPESQGIKMRAANDPTVERSVYATTTDPGELATDSTYVYWIAGTQLWRAPKNGSTTGAGIVAETNSGLTSLVVDGYLQAYWLDSTGLWQVDINCTTLPCGSKFRLSTTSGKHLFYQGNSPSLYNSTFLYWVDGNKIKSYSCSIGMCYTETFYTASTTDWSIGKLGSDGSSLFWIEYYMTSCAPLCLPNGRLQRQALSGGTATPIDENLMTEGEDLFADSSYVYYYGARRLSVNATAISHDLKADQWEVVQAIQSPTNDVPLVANKPTYVRAYGTQLSGSSANTVEAYLYGIRGGYFLAGSPLKSINGNRSLTTGGSYDRGNREDGWLFQLPDGWTDPGTLNLILLVDPRQLYYDPLPDNNSLSGSFVFNHKAPVCIVTIPVRTHGPEASPSGDNFWFAVDMVKRLWPISDVWAYHQDSDVAELQVCWTGPWDLIPYPCYGAYELPDDKDKILASLTMRDTFSDDPDECDDADARTHYVGIVHPDVDTGGVGGYGRDGRDQLWFKLPPLNPNLNDWRTPRASVLAHELGHNYDRKHVNCGNPDRIDNGYPYDVCQLDNTGADAHYGFQTTDQTVIAPNAAADFMSYGTDLWVSDYTWSALFSKIYNLAVDQSDVQSSVRPNLAEAQSVIMVSGAITPTANQGELNYAWVLPSGAMSSRVLSKWQALAVPVLDSSLMQPGSPTTPTYHIRLFDNSGTLLDDRQVTLVESYEDTENPATVNASVQIETFAATFPAPAGTVARLDLLSDSTLLARLQPGSTMPTLNIIKPSGGETFNNQMTIQWDAVDADSDDRLLFNVQYSPDGGLTWRAVANDVPGTPDTHRVTLTLNSLAGFPGSGAGQGRIRVMASDGYHTVLATSSGFTVNNHLPEPYILSPNGNQVQQPGSSIMLRGGATDAEDGGLSGSALQWKIDGSSVGTGVEVNVAGLAPGVYTVTLTAQDSLAQKQTVTATLNIGVLAFPLGGTPTLDGYCDDEAYAAATQLQLSPYSDGGRATARLVRTGSDLWVCFSGMNQKTGSSPYGLAGIAVDVNNSGGTAAQMTDYRFWVQENGSPVTDRGDGAGGYVTGGPAGLQTFVSADGAFWNAELRIPASALGGWDHLARFTVFHEWARYVSDQNRWPHTSTYNGPNTWAVALLGDWQKVFLPIVMR